MKNLLLILVFAFPVFAQQDITAKTVDGKSVTLKSDGTWIYTPALSADAPGVVYIYRLKEDAVYNRATEIRVDGKEVFEIKQGDFAGIKLAPGRHHLRTNKGDSEIGIDVFAGGRNFVLLEVGAGGFYKTHILSETPESIAVYQLKRTEFVDEKQLRAKDLPLVKERP